MKILITGAAGFVGSRMIPWFIGQGHRVIGVDRNPPPANTDTSKYEYIQQDTSKPGGWQESVGQADAVINMAGKNIFGRWSRAEKQAIRDSRVLTTRNVVDGFAGQKPAVLMNTSAVGFYGDRGETVIDESTPAGNDFLAGVSVEWEDEAVKAREKNVRVALMRFGLVMGADGGALAKMLPAFKWYVGGPLGNGRHFMPWIHIGDLIRAFDFVMSHPEADGPFNCCAPHPERNEDFTRTLGQVLHRPTFFRMPRFALRLAMGELADVMLASQRVVPKRLQSLGFDFKYPRLHGALSDLLI
ncbi:MAG: TIGR01777 family oxidoreductase [Thermodesulfobacteriota bacterium]